MAEYCMVLITVGDEDEARRIARVLVERRLAAGIQIIPIASIYRWDGEIVDDSEWLLIAKTQSNRYPEIETTVGEIHSYQVPPMAAIPFGQASAQYLKWIDDSTD